MVVSLFSHGNAMKPDFLTIDGAYACFWYNTEFATVIVPVTQLKDYKNFANEYYKVFGTYPEQMNNYSWARILGRLKKN